MLYKRYDKNLLSRRRWKKQPHLWNPEPSRRISFPGSTLINRETKTEKEPDLIIKPRILRRFSLIDFQANLCLPQHSVNFDLTHKRGDESLFLHDGCH